jgi:hypothetical protein
MALKNFCPNFGLAMLGRDRVWQINHKGTAGPAKGVKGGWTPSARTAPENSQLSAQG